MNTTLIERLPFTAAGPDVGKLPILKRYDSVESSGSLMLIDPTHPVNPWPAGVPDDGQALPNVLEENALAMLGSSTPSDARPVMKRPVAFSGAAGLLERTAKGGLHGIPSQTVAVAQSGPSVYFPPAIVKYVLDHPDNNYFLSFWDRITRKAAGGFLSAEVLAFNGSGQQTNSYLFIVLSPIDTATTPSIRPVVTETSAEHFIPEGTPPTATPSYIALESYRGVGWNTPELPGDGTNNQVTGPHAGAAVTFGPSAPWPGIGATGEVADDVFNAAGSGSGTSKNSTGAHVFYRVYLEDLTVSGRSFAEVDAIESALYSQEVLTEGGRYYGDVFTDPATVP